MTGARRTEPVPTEELFRNHAPFVARFLSRLGVAPGEVDDAVQEVFLVVHRNGGYRPGPATPAGYLASIALRAAMASRRRARKRRERAADVAPDETTSAGNDPARALEVQQSLDQLQGALDRLEPTLRTTLVLAEIEGESCTAIAATMRIPVGTVYWRLHRARKTFRLAVQAQAAIPDERATAGERRLGAVGAFLFGASPGDALLETARRQPAGAFDAAGALERFRALLRSGAGLPSWAPAAAVALKSAGVGASLVVPALVSGAIAVCVAGVGLPRWHGALARMSGPALTLDMTAAATSAPTAAATNAAPAVLADAPPAPPALPVPSPATAAPTASPATRIASVQHVAARPADGSARSEDDMREIEDTATAERLLSTDPARALSLVQSGEARYPAAYMREERRYVGVVALFKLGRLDEARAQAQRFSSDYPDGPFSQKVREMLSPL